MQVWFIGSQLPPSFTAHRRRRRDTSYEGDSGDADINDIDEEGQGESFVRHESAAMPVI